MKDPKSKEETPFLDTSEPMEADIPFPVSDEEMERSIKRIMDIIGDVPVEAIKQALRGADGNIEIAVNHLLADLERQMKAESEQEKRETISLTEKVESILSSLAEEVKCPLCLGYLNHPVVLNCVHTFCAGCLEEMASKSNVVDCPLCRAQTPLGENGVRGLNYNYYLANIVDKLKTAQTECQNNICTVFCKQCRAFLCKDCNERIHSIRLLFAHQRLPFEECFFPAAKTIAYPSRMRKGASPDEVDFVIPFNVKKEVCVDLFHAWTKQLWFAPSQLAKGRVVIHDFKALYIPFWLFEVEVVAKYNCVIFARNGPGVNNFGIPKIGEIRKHFKDLMVCASDCPEAKLTPNVEPFKVEQMQPSTLRHTDDTEVKAFTMSKEQAWENQAKLLLEKLIEKECKKKHNVSNLHIERNIISRKVKRLFVPVYVTTYECYGQEYHFIVNGATAKSFGQRPYSAGKITTLTLGSLGAALGLLSHARFSR